MRVVRLGVELLNDRNGSAAAPPSAHGGRPLPVVLHQMGVQTFRVNASAVAAVPSRGLRMPLLDAPVAGGGGGGQGVPATPQVCLRRGEALCVERVHACTSSYSTYTLVAGEAHDAATADAYLASVAGVRIHAEVRSWTEGCAHAA